MLITVLKYLRERENPIYNQLVTDRHLKVIESLAAIEEGQEFSGLIPTKYFAHRITFDPKWPISEKHKAIIKRSGSSTNIFIISKVLFFLYGMNSNMEKRVLEEFAQENPGEELEELRKKLG